jgi:hypothetical protein
MEFKLRGIISILLVSLICLSVNAQEYVKFECAENNNEYICDVKGYTKSTINAIDFKLSLPSYITSSEFTLDTSVVGSTENNWVSVIFNDETSGEYTIGQLRITSETELNTNDIQINDLIIIDGEYNEIEIDSTNKSVKKIKISTIIKLIILTCVIILIGISIYILMNKKGVIKK